MVTAHETTRAERARAGKLVSFAIAATCVGLIGVASAQWIWIDPHREVYDARVEYDLDAHDWRPVQASRRERFAPRSSYDGLDWITQSELAGGGWVIAVRDEQGTIAAATRAP